MASAGMARSVASPHLIESRTMIAVRHPPELRLLYPRLTGTTCGAGAHPVNMIKQYRYCAAALLIFVRGIFHE